MCGIWTLLSEIKLMYVCNKVHSSLYCYEGYIRTCLSQHVRLNVPKRVELVQAGCHGPSVSGEQTTMVSGQLLHSSRRRCQSTSIRSANLHRLIVPRYRRSTLGRRAFSVGGPTVWNSLPVELREPAVSDGVFRLTLKTILFARYSCTERK